MHAKSGSSHSSGHTPGEIAAYAIAAVLVVAIVVAAVFFAFRKKKTKGDAYVGPYIPPPGSFHIKSSNDFVSIL